MFLLNHRNKNKHCSAGYKNAFALKRRGFMWHIESTARSLTALEEHSKSNDTYKPHQVKEEKRMMQENFLYKINTCSANKCGVYNIYAA
jgi:hypothetical protein